MEEDRTGNVVSAAPSVENRVNDAIAVGWLRGGRGDVTAREEEAGLDEPFVGAGPVFEVARVVAGPNSPVSVSPDHGREAGQGATEIGQIVLHEAVKDALHCNAVADQ